MAENSKIQWTNHTSNPWRGCTKISPGCTNCYAETLSHRNPAVLGEWGPKGTRIIASESMWRQPLKWNHLQGLRLDAHFAAYDEWQRSGSDGPEPVCPERPRVFCASLADVFEDRPELDAPRQRLFDLILRTQKLDWLILTKRPLVMKDWLLGDGVGNHNAHTWGAGWPNVWLGVSVEDQERFKERVHVLNSIPAVVRFLSVEPQIGPVKLGESLYQSHGRPAKWWEGGPINWVIIGGESGAAARPFQVEWARSIVQECRTAGKAVFVKQMGANVVDRNDAGFEAEHEVFAEGPKAGQPTNPRAWPTPLALIQDLDGTIDGYQGAPVRIVLGDKKGGTLTEWPLDLRIRQFPGMEGGL